MLSSPNSSPSFVSNTSSSSSSYYEENNDIEKDAIDKGKTIETKKLQNMTLNLKFRLLTLF